MSATTKEMREAIQAALDCSTHFDPTIIETDEFFKLGDKAIVICDQCVERLEKVLKTT